MRSRGLPRGWSAHRLAETADGLRGAVAHQGATCPARHSTHPDCPTARIQRRNLHTTPRRGGGCMEDDLRNLIDDPRFRGIPSDVRGAKEIQHVRCSPVLGLRNTPQQRAGVAAPARRHPRNRLAVREMVRQPRHWPNSRRRIGSVFPKPASRREMSRSGENGTTSTSRSTSRGRSA